MIALRKIYQSITHKQKNHLILMVALVSLLLVSFYAFFSITDRSNTINARVNRTGGSHTSLYVDKQSFRLQSHERSSWAQNFASHTNFVESYLNKQDDVTFRYVDFIPNESEYGYSVTGELFFVAHDPEGGSYRVTEGKPLDDLQPYEIAVTKEYASYLRSRGIEPINHEITENVTSRMYDFRVGTLENDVGDYTFTIVSVIDYPNYELSFSPIKDLQDVALFREINNIPAITAQSTITELFHDVAVSTEWMADDTVNTYKVMRLFYTNYTAAREKEIVETIVNASADDAYNIVNANIFNVESFDELVSRNPLTESLLNVVVKFVVGGVLISSLYALYIQFKNQINENSQTLALYSLTGVRMSNVFKVYMIEIVGVVIIGMLVSLSGIAGLSLVLNIFKISSFVIGRIVMVSAVLIGILGCMVLIQLRTIFKKGLSKSKVGSGYQFRIASTTSNNLVRNLSWIQTLKHLPINLGMAISLALTSCILILTLSASLIMTNLYTKETFGVQFEYMIPSGNPEIYRNIYDMTENQTFVSKSSRLFTDYKISGGNSDYYKSSVITFHNFLEPYVNVIEGEYPINYSSPELMYVETGKKPELMVSRRHFDKRNLNISGEAGKKLESGFVFYTSGYNLSGTPESINASRVTGSINVLLDRGWTAFVTEPTRDLFLDQPTTYSEEEFKDKDILLYLNDETTPEVFEAYLNEKGIEFLTYDHIMNQFNEINQSMNKSAIETSLSVTVLLLILSTLSMIAIVTHIRRSRVYDFKLYNQIGITQATLKRMRRLEALIRGVVTGVVLLGMVALLYPLMISQLKQAFGLYTLPYQFYTEILSVIAIIIVMSIIALFYYQREGGKVHA